jgi:hypothetical protein
MLAFRRAQVAGGFEMRRKSESGAIMVLRPTGDEAVAAAHRRIRELLELDPQEREFGIVHGSLPASSREIALETRSMMQVLIDLASYIDVPEAEVSEGRVYLPTRTADELELYPAMMHVRTGGTPSPQAFVAVRYRDHWFWIDDRDVPSKLAFNFLLYAFSLTETGSAQATPIVTIPAR